MSEHSPEFKAYLEGNKVTPLKEVYRLKGKVVHGFGRGSKMLGFPTANLDPCAFRDTMVGVERGVYVGFAKVRRVTGTGDAQDAAESEVYPAMLSLGTAPQFEDSKEETVEAYICHKFACDFYGDELSLLVCAHIRPMRAFASLDELIAAINNDVKIGNEVGPYSPPSPPPCPAQPRLPAYPHSYPLPLPPAPLPPSPLGAGRRAVIAVQVRRALCVLILPRCRSPRRIARPFPFPLAAARRSTIEPGGPPRRMFCRFHTCPAIEDTIATQLRRSPPPSLLAALAGMGRRGCKGHRG